MALKNEFRIKVPIIYEELTIISIPSDVRGEEEDSFRIEWTEKIESRREIEGSKGEEWIRTYEVEGRFS